MQDVFVSYRHSRKAEVIDFCELMNAAGLTFFRDEERREDDDSIQRTIETGLADAKLFLAWYDPTYLQSKACAWEFSRVLLAAHAGSEGLKRIVCVDPEATFGHIVPTVLKDQARLVSNDTDALVRTLRERVDRVFDRFGKMVMTTSTRWHGLQRPSHPTWVGRASLLIELFDMLDAGRLAMHRGERAPVALTGWGGEGKTMLAQQYALRFAAAYPGGIVWLRGATADGVTAREGEWLQHLETSLTAVATGELAIDVAGLGEGVLDPRQRIARLRAAIERGLHARLEGESSAPIAPYLWIVDDLPRGLDADDMRLWLAQDERAHCLVTLRERKGIDAVFHALSVVRLDRDEALHVLTRRRSPTDEAESAAATTIVEELGRLPLALEAGGAYAAERGYARYLAFLNERSTGEVDQLVTTFTGALPTGHEASIVKTLLRSIDLLPGWDRQSGGKEAVDATWMTLRLAALLAPQPLPQVFAVRVLDASGHDTAGGMLFDRVYAGLFGAGLIQQGESCNDDVIGLHALIARTVVDVRTTASQRKSLFEMSMGALERWVVAEKVKSPVLINPALFSVALATIRYADAEQSPRALLGVGFEAWRAGRLAVAHTLESRVLEIRMNRLGREHPDTLTSMNNLAETMRSQGDLQGARHLQDQLLVIIRRVLGEEHPSTVTSMSNLASTMRLQGDLQGARDLQDQGLAIRRRTLGEGHPDTLASMSNLASTMHSQGDLQGARDLQDQVLLNRRRVLGEQHPDTLMSMNNLAETMRAQGELRSARDLQDQVLVMCRRVLGEEHPDTLASMGNLALTMQSLGVLQGARDLQDQVWVICRRVLGEEHPDTLTSMSNLALTMQSQGALHGARDLQDQVLMIRSRLLGEEHPDTLTSMSNLALTMQSQGDLQGARDLQDQGLAIRRRTLGERHPDTLASMSNLASTMHSQGDLEGARDLQDQVLAIFRRVLGAEHPSTLTSMSNLASTMRLQGDLKGARDLQEQVLAIFRCVLDEKHPDTLTSMNNLAETMRTQGDLQGARDLQDRVLMIRRRVLGEKHPDTLTSMGNLALTMQSQGELQDARDLQDQVLAIRRRLLGEEHPSTLTSMSNLASAMRSQGDLEGARDLQDQVLMIRRRVLSEKHPDTMAAHWNLYESVCALGDLATVADLESFAERLWMRADATDTALAPLHEHFKAQRLAHGLPPRN